jgi:ribose/xylose/arabinose/galactoside ABC-type transport system permease subunit
VLTFIILAACSVYLYMAIGRVNGASGAMRAVQAIVLTLAVGAIVSGCRFVLFLLTLYATRAPRECTRQSAGTESSLELSNR